MSTSYVDRGAWRNAARSYREQRDVLQLRVDQLTAENEWLLAVAEAARRAHRSTTDAELDDAVDAICDALDALPEHLIVRPDQGAS